jgi:hypothetical protein
MTGILNAMAGRAGYVNLCSVSALGGGVFRAGGTGGPISPNAPFKGATIVQAESISTTLGFRIYLSGNQVQTFFSQLMVQDSAGVFRTLTSASATTFGFNGSETGWEWSVAGGTSLVWTSAGTRLLQLYP